MLDIEDDAVYVNMTGQSPSFLFFHTSQKIIFTTSYYFDAWFFESTKQQGERAIGFTRTLKTRKNI